MRFGMFDQIEDPGGTDLQQVYRDRLRLAVRAEEAGFWGYHKSEHHMIPLDVAPSISVFLGALSQLTSRMRLCSLVHLLPFHHPLQLAEEIAMVDILSGGRFELGFGKGVSAPEHALWGLQADEAEDRLDESLSIVLAALQADDSFSYEGRFWSFHDVPVMTHPLQKPYPPLWRPGTLGTAAGMGVSTMVGGPIANVAASVALYREHYQPGIGGGHTPTIGGVRKIYVADTDAEAEARVRRAWRPYTEHLTRLFRRFEMTPPGDPTLGGNVDLALQVQAVVAGSPARIREHLEQFRAESGTDYFVGAFAWGDLSGDEAARSFDLFVEAADGLLP